MEMIDITRCFVLCVLMLILLVDTSDTHDIEKRQVNLIIANNNSQGCKANEYGSNCTPCVPQDTCLNGHYTCDVSSGNKICLPGYIGENCTAPDNPGTSIFHVSCPENNCRNGGSCVSGSCCCVFGFTGILCEVEIIECQKESCLNGGICKDLIGSYDCLCMPGFTGRRCETTTQLTTPYHTWGCQSNPCKNAGTCFEDEVFMYCVCPTWFTGRFCEVDLKPTGHNPNHCRPHHYGVGCNSVCRPENTCAGGHYVCNPESGLKICLSGWTGRECETRLLPQALDPECTPGIGCKNDGSCFQQSCCCRHNYTGDACEIASIGCVSHPCQNGASCINVGNSFACLCTANFTGSQCEWLLTTTTTTTARTTFTTTTKATTTTTFTTSKANTTVAGLISPPPWQSSLSFSQSVSSSSSSSTELQSISSQHTSSRPSTLTTTHPLSQLSSTVPLSPSPSILPSTSPQLGLNQSLSSLLTSLSTLRSTQSTILPTSLPTTIKATRTIAAHLTPSVQSHTFQNSTVSVPGLTLATSINMVTSSSTIASTLSNTAEFTSIHSSPSVVTDISPVSSLSVIIGSTSVQSVTSSTPGYVSKTVAISQLPLSGINTSEFLIQPSASLEMAHNSTANTPLNQTSLKTSLLPSSIYPSITSSNYYYITSSIKINVTATSSNVQTVLSTDDSMSGYLTLFPTELLSSNVNSLTSKSSYIFTNTHGNEILTSGHSLDVPNTGILGTNTDSLISLLHASTETTTGDISSASSYTLPSTNQHANQSQVLSSLTTEIHNNGAQTFITPLFPTSSIVIPPTAVAPATKTSTPSLLPSYSSSNSAVGSTNIDTSLPSQASAPFQNTQTTYTTISPSRSFSQTMLTTNTKVSQSSAMASVLTSDASKPALATTSLYPDNTDFSSILTDISIQTVVPSTHISTPSIKSARITSSTIMDSTSLPTKAILDTLIATSTVSFITQVSKSNTSRQISPTITQYRDTLSLSSSPASTSPSASPLKTVYSSSMSFSSLSTPFLSPPFSPSSLMPFQTTSRVDFPPSTSISSRPSSSKTDIRVSTHLSVNPISSKSIQPSTDIDATSAHGTGSSMPVPGNNNTNRSTDTPEVRNDQQKSAVWKIVVIVIGCLILLVLTIVIIVYIVVRQRRKDSINIQDAVLDLSVFNKEHFSVEPEFTLPTYEMDNDSDDDSVKHDMYVVNEG